MIINSCFQERAPARINRLLGVRTCNYNLWEVNALALPRVNSTKYGVNYFSYYVAKRWNASSDNLRALAGTREFAIRVCGLKF